MDTLVIVGLREPLAADNSNGDDKSARTWAHIIASNYLQLFYSFQPTKILLAA